MGYRAAYEYVPVRANVVKNTAAYPAQIVRVQALEDSVVASIESTSLLVNGATAKNASFTMERGTSIDDILISSITLSSGSVICYSID